MILYILQDGALPAAIAEVFLSAANGTLGMPEQLRHAVFLRKNAFNRLLPV
jgi:hypothetical protein